MTLPGIMADTKFSTELGRIFGSYLTVAALLAAMVLAGADASVAQTVGGGQTPSAEVNERLFEAVFNDDLDAVRVGIADGADIEARGRLGRNPLELAIDLGHFEIARYLLALRHHRRTVAARKRPPAPAPPPPFVPLEPTPAPAAPATPAAVESASVSPPAAAVPPAVTSATEPAPLSAVAPPPPRPLPAPPPSSPAIASPTPEKVSGGAEVTVAVAPRTGQPQPTQALVSKLGLGTSMWLGQSLDGGATVESPPCVKKRRGATRICVLPVEWPAEVEDHFLVESFLYSGVKALVRYEDDAAMRLYAQFPADSFEAISEYHKRRLGPPTEVTDHEVKLQGGGKTANRVLVWERGDPAGKRTSILEIRHYDDVRRTTAAPRFGVIQAYFEGSKSLFSQLSALDLMRLR